MKKLVPVLLLLVTGCGPRTGQDDNQTLPLPDNPLANLQIGTSAQDEARLQALIERAMPAALPDAATARYRGVRAGVGGSVCGEVAAAAAASAPFRHFVITPDALAVVGTGPGIKFNDPSDFLADAWIRWCATPEELKLVEAQLDRGPLPSTDGLIEGMAPPSAPGEPPPKQTATAPPRPTTQIDSFSQSVARPQ